MGNSYIWAYITRAATSGWFAASVRAALQPVEVHIKITFSPIILPIAKASRALSKYFSPVYSIKGSSEFNPCAKSLGR